MGIGIGIKIGYWIGDSDWEFGCGIWNEKLGLGLEIGDLDWGFGIEDLGLGIWIGNWGWGLGLGIWD